MGEERRREPYNKVRMTMVEQQPGPWYTGVGSRRVPEGVVTQMELIARTMSKEGWCLRSGHAEGSDRAFEYAHSGRKEIYLAKHADQEAIDMAMQYHGAPERCSDYAKMLHGRNAYQVLGLELNRPSSFVVCWTGDGCKTHEFRSIATGGTGTAISIAEQRGIMVFNLEVDKPKNVLEYARSVKCQEQ